jgi:prepilin-type N-terminal cleavage/methylation domain-containing protein
MNGRMSNEKGFTLIEVIVSLVLIGILAAIAGMGLVKIAEGYVFAKQNAETVQKAQIAMARIVKELGAATISTTTPPTATSVTYTRPESATSTTLITNTITFSNPNITVKVGSSGTPTILIDNVTDNVTGLPPLAYVYAIGSTTTPAANIRRIDITLTVRGANNQSLPSFTNNVYIQESY